uniref:Uncharacterized protein n=1 Tax=viral metagenome TaxID=1070528 RepID=A0A6M3JWR0_9ZZZZ
MLSKARNIIAGKVTRFGSTYTSNETEFKAIIAKSQVSYDKPTQEFTLLAGYNADITDGYLISGQDDNFIPTKIDRPNMMGGNDQYTRGYLRQANASIDIKSYINPSNASKDVWDAPSEVEGTDWGWVIQKTSVFVNFEKMELRPENRPVGQIESAEFMVTIPWSVNASFTPIAECRLSDRNGRNWRVLDIDDKSYINQAYLVRVGSDAR